MESYFNQLKEIKGNFKDLNQGKEEYKISNGLLSNFSKFLSENRLAVYALAGIGMINAVSTSTKVEHLDIDKLFAPYETSAQSLMKNNKYNNNLPELTNNKIAEILSQKANNGYKEIIKNPFWKGNILTIEVNDQKLNFHNHEELNKPVKLDVNSALLMVDKENHKINLDAKEINEAGNSFQRKSSVEEFQQYVVYHEAAHGTLRQSLNFNNENKINQFTEAHADMSSVMLFAKRHGNDLNKFNDIVDDVISFRKFAMSNFDFSHQSVYPMLELKSMINKNPELLKMKDENITEFTYKVLDNLNKQDYKNDLVNFVEKRNIDISKETFLNNIKTEEKTSDLNNYIYYSVFGNNKTLKEWINMNPERRVDRFSERMNQEITHVDSNVFKYSSLMYLVDKNNFDNNLKEVYKDIQSNSKVDQSIIEQAKKDIYYQSIDFSSGIKDERIESMIKSVKNKI